MYEVAFVLFEQDGMSRENAMRYWATKHADIVWSVPGVKRYLQSNAFLSPGDPPFLGMALLGFEDEAAFQAAAASPEFAAAVADLENFSDPKRLPTVVMNATSPRR